LNKKGAYEKEFYNEVRLENWLGDYLSDMYVANINGSYWQNITKFLQPGGFFDAEWSPDNKYFAFLVLQRKVAIFSHIVVGKCYKIVRQGTLSAPSLPKF